MPSFRQRLFPVNYKPVLISCEHGGNEVPQPYRSLFSGHRTLLESHRGYDPGALEIAEYLAEHLKLPLFYSTTTRLLVDLNRSLHHPHLFSGITRDLEIDQKEKILETYYHPYRTSVESHIEDQWKKKTKKEILIHLSIHSFTPVMDGIPRRVDLGLLYDPGRKWEKVFASTLRDFLQSRTGPEDFPEKIRRNVPYRGRTDGFTTHLRKRFPEGYGGLELEINQIYCKQPLADRKIFRRNLLESLRESFAGPGI